MERRVPPHPSALRGEGREQVPEGWVQGFVACASWHRASHVSQGRVFGKGGGKISPSVGINNANAQIYPGIPGSKHAWAAVAEEHDAKQWIG
jgi:hypothetical protein